MALIGFGFSGLLRTDGVWGNFALGLDWRWNETKEDLLVASKAVNSESISVSDVTNELDAALANPEWPGFRGVDRNSHVRGVSLATDWRQIRQKKSGKLLSAQAGHRLPWPETCSLPKSSGGRWNAWFATPLKPAKRFELRDRITIRGSDRRPWPSRHADNRRRSTICDGSSGIPASHQASGRIDRLAERHSKSCRTRSADVGFFLFASCRGRECRRACWRSRRQRCACLRHGHRRARLVDRIWWPFLLFPAAQRNKR